MWTKFKYSITKDGNDNTWWERKNMASLYYGFLPTGDIICSGMLTLKVALWALIFAIDPIGCQWGGGWDGESLRGWVN